MTIPEIQSFKLLDGTTIPWIAWGNGTGNASKDAVRLGELALASGIRHLDTAQLYKNEKETGDAIEQSSFSRGDIYVTSKISAKGDKEEPVPLGEVGASVESSIDRLGFIPNLYLVHNPYVARDGELKALWKILEGLKSEGKLHSIGVSNFRPQDLEEILDGAKYKPVVNQLEYHPYTLAHLEPVLALHAKHGIVTASYGALTPVIRHPTGGPLKPVLERIAQRISKAAGKKLDSSIVLLLWTRAQGVVAVTTSANPDRIKALGEIATLPNLLEQSEIDEITNVGKSIHYRFYTEHMEKDFPLPDLPHE
ncbi:conjugated polyketone reductase C1 [Crassisporium funariophilum]|nr:conjugated polyketone reductase C1 [Crassisporium funariophilum]